MQEVSAKQSLPHLAGITKGQFSMFKFNFSYWPESFTETYVRAPWSLLNKKREKIFLEQLKNKEN